MNRARDKSQQHGAATTDDVIRSMFPADVVQNLEEQKKFSARERDDDLAMALSSHSYR